MDNLNQLEPLLLWKYFGEICKVPRLSKREEKIRKYLLGFAEAHKLEAKEDRAGNILITRPAAPGMENRSTIVLQSHMDMVGEKDSDNPHDWDNDPIKPIVKNGWVTADGTTLGADDGIGMAAQMAVLTDRGLKTGRIEALFTSDEETGLTGAFGLEPGFFSGKVLLNLDSEDEGILYIGCAGGMDTVATLSVHSVPAPASSIAVSLSVTGLRGGHSGDEIHKGFGNSVKIMTRLLLHLTASAGVEVESFNGGNLRNAIPREAFATIVIPGNLLDYVTAETEAFTATILSESGSLESDLQIGWKKAAPCYQVLEKEGFLRLLHALNCCPQGVMAWSKDMEGLVETSTNLASVKMDERPFIRVVTSQRSSVESAKHYAASSVASCFILAGASIEHSDGYPGWKPDPLSPLLKAAKESYRKLFGSDPEVKAIHAGLECGLFCEKFPGIDMVSFGPTIKGAHTPQEMIDIASVSKFWDLLRDLIFNIR